MQDGPQLRRAQHAGAEIAAGPLSATNILAWCQQLQRPMGAAHCAACAAGMHARVQRAALTGCTGCEVRQSGAQTPLAASSRRSSAAAASFLLVSSPSGGSMEITGASIPPAWPPASPCAASARLAEGVPWREEP